MRSLVCGIAMAAALTASGPATAQQATPPPPPELRVGSLLDTSGPTAMTGRIIAAGKADAFAFVNRTGAINGKRLTVDSFDYAYQAPRALAQLRKWKAENVIAVQGYREMDAEAWLGMPAEERLRVPFWTLAPAAQLADPQGKGPRGSRAAPFTFAALPTYSDGARALLQWAAEDWKRRGRQGKPRFVHMGDSQPLAGAARAASEEFAREQGFEVIPQIAYPVPGEDGEAPCLSLKLAGATHAYLANPAAENVVLLRSCRALGVQVQFLANLWGLHEPAMKLAGEAADGVVMVGAGAPWGADVPGMRVLQEVARNSDPSGREYRPLPYARAVCGVLYMAEAMKWADQNGGITPDNIRNAMYQRKNWVPYGLDGVCGPASYSNSDHRGITAIGLLQAQVKGPTEQGEVGELMRNGTIALRPLQTIEVPRKPEWLGW